MKGWLFIICFTCSLFFLGCGEDTKAPNDMYGTPLPKPHKNTKLSKLRWTLIQDSLRLIQEYHEDSVHFAEMKELKEPDLMNEKYEVYRMIYWVAFRDNILLFRIENKNEAYTLTVKDILPAYYSRSHKDTLLHDTVLTLNADNWKEFKNLINASYFWSLSRHEPSPVAVGYSDGWDCDLEGFIGNTSYIDTADHSKGTRRFYHRVMRQCPYDGSFDEACRKLIELSGLFKSIKKPMPRGFMPWIF